MSVRGRERETDAVAGCAESMRNEELEREVLGAMIASPASADEVAAVGLRSRDLWLEAHRIVFDAIRALRDEGVVVDRHTLRMRMERDGTLSEVGTPEDLGALQAAASPPDAVRTHTGILRNLARRRAAIEIASKVRLEAEGGRMGGDEVVAYGEGLFAELDPVDSTGRPSTSQEAATSALDSIVEAYENGGRIVGARTGIESLDEILRGLRPGTLNVVAARPSMGKSALGLQIARSVARGTTKDGEVLAPSSPALFFSLEMPTKRIWIRHLAAQTRMDALRLEAGVVHADQRDSSGDDEWTRLVRGVGDLAQQPLYTVESSSLTVPAIRSQARHLTRRLERDGEKLGVVIIDYLGLLEADKHYADRRLEVAAMSRGLKALAQDLDVPVVLLAQLTRGPEMRHDKRPLLSDLRESGDVEQDADTVTMIYRDDYYHPDSEDKGTAELLVRKNREGKTGTARVSWLASYQFFGDLARHLDEENAPQQREHVPTFVRQ